MDNESILVTSEDTASVGVVHESISITGGTEECLEAVAGLEVDLDFKLCTSVLGLARADILCGS